MTPEQAKKANEEYVKRLMDRTESLQTEMHSYIKEAMEGKDVSYQDAVNTFLLFKLAQMDLRKANHELRVR